MDEISCDHMKKHLPMKCSFPSGAWFLFPASALLFKEVLSKTSFPEDG